LLVPLYCAGEAAGVQDGLALSCRLRGRTGRRIGAIRPPLLDLREQPVPAHKAFTLRFEKRAEVERRRQGRFRLAFLQPARDGGHDAERGGIATEEANAVVLQQLAAPGQEGGVLPSIVELLGPACRVVVEQEDEDEDLAAPGLLVLQLRDRQRRAVRHETLAKRDEQDDEIAAVEAVA
jgi:hypothetical protein